MKPLSFLLAPDSLKGSLSATQACHAMQRGAERALGSRAAQFQRVPLADGGEGTIEAFVVAIGGEVWTHIVCGPLGQLVQAQWAILSDGTAVIEMAQASGLTLVADGERDAMRASSYGTGQLIRAALNAGCRELLVGVGGSATTDGGSGALSALGARFLDANGEELPPGGAALSQLATVDLQRFDHRVLDCQLRVLCDVSNPLCGERGAARVYGPQKGASSVEVALLDAALSHFADVTRESYGADLRELIEARDEAGAGAAGGIAFGLMSYCGAQLISGIEAVLQAAHFSEKLETANLVLTAEGVIDEQTPQGKTLAGVARAARNAKSGMRVPVVAFGGRVALGGEELSQMGIAAAFSLADGPQTIEYSMSHAAELLEAATERAIRLWLCGQYSS